MTQLQTEPEEKLESSAFDWVKEKLQQKIYGPFMADDHWFYSLKTFIYPQLEFHSSVKFNLRWFVSAPPHCAACGLLHVPTLLGFTRNPHFSCSEITSFRLQMLDNSGSQNTINSEASPIISWQHFLEMRRLADMGGKMGWSRIYWMHLQRKETLKVMW